MTGRRLYRTLPPVDLVKLLNVASEALDRSYDDFALPYDRQQRKNRDRQYEAIHNEVRRRNWRPDESDRYFSEAMRAYR